MKRYRYAETENSKREKIKFVLASRGVGMENKMNFKIEKEGILQGWNTWDTYCAPCFLYLPGSCGVRLGIKEYLRGQYLDGANIGRRGKEGESIRPGLHAYDGSYTEQTITWRGLSIHIESAAEGKTLVIRAECLENDSCFAPALIVEKVGGWREQGMELTVLSGQEKKEPYLPVRGECICLELSKPIKLCMEMQGAEEAFAQKGGQEEAIFSGKETKPALLWRKEVWRFGRSLDWNVLLPCLEPDLGQGK